MIPVERGEKPTWAHQRRSELHPRKTRADRSSALAPMSAAAAAATPRSGTAAAGARDALAHLHAAARADDVPAVTANLRAGRNLGAVDAAGNTMLHVAAHAGALSVLRLLLSSGAEVDSRGAQLRTPLHDAAAAGHGTVIEILLRHGADPKLFDASGRTPRQAALASGQVYAARILDDTSVRALHQRHREGQLREVEEQRRALVQTLAGDGRMPPAASLEAVVAKRAVDKTISRLAFSLADSDGDGRLSRDEIGAVLSTQGLRSDPAFVDALLLRYDMDQSGYIELDEFNRVLPLLSSQAAANSSPRARSLQHLLPPPADARPGAPTLRTDGLLDDVEEPADVKAAKEAREYDQLKLLAGEIDHACRVAGVKSVVAHGAAAAYPPKDWSVMSPRVTAERAPATLMPQPGASAASAAAGGGGGSASPRPSASPRGRWGQDLAPGAATPRSPSFAPSFALPARTRSSGTSSGGGGGGGGSRSPQRAEAYPPPSWQSPR
jgi:hypothetical protein